MKPLENKPYLLISNAGQRLLVEMGDIDSLQQVVPGGWTVKAAQQIHERRLPAAACAHDGDEFAKLDRNAHPAQGVHSRLAKVIVLVHAFDTDDGLRIVLRQCIGSER